MTNGRNVTNTQQLVATRKQAAKTKKGTAKKTSYQVQRRWFRLISQEPKKNASI